MFRGGRHSEICRMAGIVGNAMKNAFIGDSYDIVKKFMIQSLAPDAKWVAFPMFSDEISPDRIKAFERFIDIQVISTNIITASTNRTKHLAASEHHRHIFIDPDTGIKLEPTNSVKRNKYVFGEELVRLCKQSPERLLLVFDQSVQRGKENQSIEKKLNYFQSHDLCAFAYVSHACFVVLSASNSVCRNAYDRLLDSGLPSWRLYPENAKQIAHRKTIE